MSGHKIKQPPIHYRYAHNSKPVPRPQQRPSGSPHLSETPESLPPRKVKDDDKVMGKEKQRKPSPSHSSAAPPPPPPNPPRAATRDSASAEVKQPPAAAAAPFRPGPASVEDVCLGCRGECICGGATGAAIYVPSGTTTSVSGPRGPLKVRITMSSLSGSNAASTSASTSTSTFLHPSHFSPPAVSPPLPPVPNHKPRSFSEEHEAYEDRPRKKVATTTHTKKKGTTSTLPPARAPRDKPTGGDPPRKRGRPRKDRSLDGSVPPPRPPKASTSTSSSSTSTPTALTNPSRMSLRQVLAASIRDTVFSEMRDPSPPPPVFVPAPTHGRRVKERLEDVSDLELDSSGSGSEGEDAIERAEERALREEFEREARFQRDQDEGAEVEDEDEDEEISSGADLSEFDEEDEGREARARKARGGREGSSVEQAESDAEDEDMEFGGGRGVVTWSDYGSVRDDGDDEEDDDPAGEFENELEELLALSEAVVGPIRNDEYELGEMWFEEISNQGDDEDDSGDESGSDDDDDGEETIIITIDEGSAWHHERRHGSPSSEDSAEYDDDDMEWSSQGDGEDGGDTTDSLDSDDHVGLVRFGIEVDSDDDSSSSASESDYPHLPPGTASLADVQAPTLADLASLPQYLFAHVSSGVVDGVDVMLLDDDARDLHTDQSILDGVNRALLKGKGRAPRIPDIDVEEEGSSDHPTTTERRRSPAMGVFGTKDTGRTAELVVVIDESNTLAPSPFSKLKRSRRHGRHLLDGTPSRRTRADSKVSTTSGPSVTDGSLSGELGDLPSPFVSADAMMDFDFDEVLNASVLQQDGDTTSSESEVEVESQLQGGLSDLQRWNRIPIGAFRSSSSTMPSSSFFSHPSDHAAAVDPRQLPLFLPSTSSILRRSGSTSLSHTLSSPQTLTTTRRSIERRMLTSPVFGPASNQPLVAGPPPKSHKAKRKEKRKTTSSTMERVMSPKAFLNLQLPSTVATPSSLLAVAPVPVEDRPLFPSSFSMASGSW